MATWPSKKKLTHPLRRDPQAIFITVKTQMYCGHKIELKSESAKNREFSTKDRLSDDIDQRAKHHIRNCDKCKKYYG